MVDSNVLLCSSNGVDLIVIPVPPLIGVHPRVAETLVACGGHLRSAAVSKCRTRIDRIAKPRKSPDSGGGSHRKPPRVVETDHHGITVYGNRNFGLGLSNAVARIVVDVHVRRCRGDWEPSRSRLQA